MSGGWLEDVFARADIVRVAERLGLQVEQRSRTPRRALCPFHKDTDPSLHLYTERKAGRQHYHCFACAAHGDILDLVKGVKGLDFGEAAAWLCEEIGLPRPSAGATRVDSRAARERLRDLLRAPSRRLDAFADERGHAVSFLRARDIGACSLQPLVREGERDKLFAEALIQAGLVSVATGPSERAPELLPGPALRPFFSGERVVFPIEDIDGGTAGYVARALDDKGPKYLFSRGFRRAQALYGARAAAQAAAEATGAFTLFVVEGVMDALRLQSVGHVAVALLGARATSDQTALVGRILDRAEKALTKSIVLYLDPDEAGRAGSVATLRSLIAEQRAHGPFSLELVEVPARDAHAPKADPDVALRGVSPEGARTVLAGRRPALLALAAWHLGRSDDAGFDDEALSRLPALERATAARRIADACDPDGLSLWLGPTVADERDPLAGFARLVLAYARPGARTYRGSDDAEISAAPRPSDDADVLRAIELSESTAKRREYPVDEAAFLRLEIAGSALYHVHAERLRLGSGPAEPYPSRHVPKGGGRYRRKCGPVAEDIVQQQYLLSGLLRTHPASPGVEAAIPAVRFADGERRLTGPHTSADDVPLSFAYQLDQAIADGVAPPRRAGMFRDYYKCWLDFIGFIEERLRKMRHGTVHVLRLDIAGYYDNLRRSDVEAALHAPIIAATKAASSAGRKLLPLVAPKEEDPRKRADAILDLLLDHSFGYTYRDPETGRDVRASPDVGVPQGPDLSAYMANVALFGLDAIMRREIAALDGAARKAAGDETVVGATYARYVDDMVLVCGDRATLNRLERRIAEHLAGMGLRLSPKNERLSPMTLRQARAWVTDNRSGAGFSGPLDDVAARAFFDPLADAGDTPPDRKLALGLLGDPALEASAAYEVEADEARERVFRQVKTALEAIEVRHNDRSRAYAILWRIAIAGVPESEREAAVVASAFVELVRAAEPPALRPEAHVPHDRAMAALDGLELVLRRERWRDAATTEDERRQLELRDDLAALDVPALTEAAVRGLHAPLGEAGAKAADRFLERYDVTLQRATSVVAACGHARSGAARNLESLRPAFDGERRKWPGSIGASLRRFGQDVTPDLVEGLGVDLGRDAVAFRLLHRDIAEWQRWADRGADVLDFVQPLDEPPGDSLLRIVSDIRRVWTVQPRQTSDATTPTRNEASVAAATALLNIALTRAGDLLHGRRNVVALLLDGGEDGDATAVDVFLPPPPTLEIPEALLVRGDTIIHVGLRDLDQAPSIIGLDFGEPRTVAERLVRRDARLPGFAKLIDTFAGGGARYRQDRPGDLASAYRAFLAAFRKVEGDREERVVLPSAHSFFLREGGGKTEHHVVAWACPPDEADDFASLRDGGALAPEPIFEEGAPYWRFGWALVDAFDYARGLPNPAVRREDGHPPAAGAPDIAEERHEDEAQLADALVRNACAKLTGTDMFGPGQPDEHGVPSRIARGLALLEAFEEARADAWTPLGRARAATIALATYADGVMVNERIERPGEPERPGGPAALIARAARRGGRGVPQARTHWVGSSTRKDDWSVALPPLRRDAAAWFALADRVAARAEDAARVSEAPRTLLSPLVAGMRILGLVRGLRGLVHDLVRKGGESTGSALANLPLDVPALAALIGEDAALVERPDPTSSRGESPSRDLAQELAATLARVEASLAAGGQGQASAVTPLGWAVLAAGLAQAAPLAEEDRCSPSGRRSRSRATPPGSRGRSSRSSRSWLAAAPRRRSQRAERRPIRGRRSRSFATSARALGPRRATPSSPSTGCSGSRSRRSTSTRIPCIATRAAAAPSSCGFPTDRPAIFPSTRSCATCSGAGIGPPRERWTSGTGCAFPRRWRAWAIASSPRPSPPTTSRSARSVSGASRSAHPARPMRTPGEKRRARAGGRRTPPKAPSCLPSNRRSRRPASPSAPGTRPKPPSRRPAATAQARRRTREAPSPPTRAGGRGRGAMARSSQASSPRYEALKGRPGGTARHAARACAASRCSSGTWPTRIGSRVTTRTATFRS